jgi:hypothetical protein
VTLFLDQPHRLGCAWLLQSSRRALARRDKRVSLRRVRIAGRRCLKLLKLALLCLTLGLVAVPLTSAAQATASSHYFSGAPLSAALERPVSAALAVSTRLASTLSRLPGRRIETLAARKRAPALAATPALPEGEAPRAQRRLYLLNHVLLR